MRVTGGRVRGHHLATLRGLLIRPSSDLIRQAVFNLIGREIYGVKVLDLFAGTGSLGIEALSRGAFEAVFIDNSNQAVKLIKQNLERCGYEALGSIVKKDLGRGLPRNRAFINNRFELVFMDPPYGKAFIPPLLKELSDRKVLSDSSMVVTESSKFDILPAVSGALQLVKDRTYGETKINIYHYKGTHE
jgi:16S rRNA (guanine966-N2)-methyltransferase